VTGSSDALVLVSRKRLAAFQGRTYALPAEAAQARERSGEARKIPVQTAEGSELRGQHRTPDEGGSHPAQPASVEAQVRSSLVSEVALASRDVANVRKAIDRFYAFRRRMEMEQKAVIKVNIAQTFQQLGLPEPVTNLAVEE
jgi:hypothetical protein